MTLSLQKDDPETWHYVGTTFLEANPEVEGVDADFLGFVICVLLAPKENGISELLGDPVL